MTISVCAATSPPTRAEQRPFGGDFALQLTDIKCCAEHHAGDDQRQGQQRRQRRAEAHSRKTRQGEARRHRQQQAERGRRDADPQADHESRRRSCGWPGWRRTSAAYSPPAENSGISCRKKASQPTSSRGSRMKPSARPAAARSSQCRQCRQCRISRPSSPRLIFASFHPLPTLHDHRDAAALAGQQRRGRAAGRHRPR